ncbi:MAG: molybdopterin-dependent oxidoreductase [Ilumatobacter fluminis]|uniref:molybdopterin-dependent oxidoreductase n=1 Tax=Ilumatobacter fluminis TaxID=467091 RepID=UPI0032EF6846
MSERIAVRTCPLCEAGCGLEITLTTGDDGTETVKRIRGDRDDVFSGGYICPKGSTLGHLHDDPDRLRRPVVRRDGEFVEVSWDEAFATIEAGLMPLLQEHGRDSCAIYLGNPGAHSLGPVLYNRSLITALGSRNRFSASTVDQRPKELSAGLMFGSVSVPVPDLDRTDFLLMLGANPHASNGSLCTAPDFPGRLDRIQERGGTIVVVDPRRSETAERADRHLAIRPGGDAHLLAAIANVLVTDGLADVGRLAEHTNALDDVVDALGPFTPERVETATGLDADTIRTLAHDVAAAPTAAVYGRIGTCTQEFGTLASWLVDIVNLLSGNLDRVGGAMFAKGAVGQPSTKGAPGTGRGMRIGRVTSRAGGRPESLGEFPVTALPEEIETPGDGQVRALITVAGNPVSSNPNSERLDAALGSLEFMVSIDPYINETTRHADVILPPPSALEKSHYDIALLNFAVHNVANYSPAVIDASDDQPEEWEIILRLAGLLGGGGANSDIDSVDDQIAAAVLGSAVRDEHSSIHGRDPAELNEQLDGRRGPERLLDIMLRTGPYGDGFGTDPDGLSLAVLEANPHGVDLGALEADRVPDVLRTPSGKIEAFPDAMRADMDRFTASLDREADDMVLVGRRHVRSNNSWMHNVRVLTKGRNRCTLQVHPDDADRLGLRDGAPATVQSRVGEVSIDVEVTDGIRPGVVSIPHGFGQNLPGVQLRVAQEYRGVNTNVLTDELFYDEISGNIALNGVPVTVSPS